MKSSKLQVSGMSIYQNIDCFPHMVYLLRFIAPHMYQNKKKSKADIGRTICVAFVLYWRWDKKLMQSKEKA